MKWWEHRTGWRAWEWFVVAAVMAATLLAGGCGRRAPLSPAEQQRLAMVQALQQARIVTSPDLARALRNVAREQLLPEHLRDRAYTDCHLRLSPTMFEPSPVIQAAMIEAARVRRGQRVLDMDPGAGYRAALCAAMGANVYCLVPNPGDREQVSTGLDKLGFGNVSVSVGHQAVGLPASGPYNVLFANWAAGRVPETIIDQVRNQGRIVLLPAPARDRIEVLVNQKTTLERVETIIVAQICQAFASALESVAR